MVLGAHIPVFPPTSLAGRSIDRLWHNLLISSVCSNKTVQFSSNFRFCSSVTGSCCKWFLHALLCFSWLIILCSSALDQGQGCIAATAAADRYLGALQHFLGTGISESTVQIVKEKTEGECSSTGLRLQGVPGASSQYWSSRRWFPCPEEACSY